MRWRWLGLGLALLASPSALAAPWDDRSAVRMTGAPIEAADFRCAVESFNNDRTVGATCTEKGTGAIRERTFSFNDMGSVVELDRQPLVMVTDRASSAQSAVPGYRG